MYSSIPILFLAFFLGLNKNDKTTANHYVNIHNHTNLKFIYNVLNWSSYNQNLLLLGSRALVNLSFYFEDDDAKVNIEYNKINSILFYFYFAFCLIPQIMRYPSNELTLKYISKYLSNILNGLSYSLFDGYALVEIYTLFSVSIFKTNAATKKDYLDNSLYFTIFCLSFIYSLHARYTNTQNIPEYSNRKIPNKESYCRKSLSFFCFSERKNKLTHPIENNK